MSRVTFFTFAAGMLLLIALVASQGAGSIFAVLQRAGWSIAWVAVYRLVPIAIDAVGWRLLIRNRPIPGLDRFVINRWIAESCNTLLPVAQLGGHMLRAMLLARQGAKKAVAGASVVVDFTLGLTTQFIFVVGGLALMVAGPGGNLQVGMFIAGSVAGFLLIAGFVAVQKMGIAGLIAGASGRVFKKERWAVWATDMRQVEIEMSIIYARYAALLWGAAVRMAGWLAKSGEPYLALFVLGHPVSLLQAVMLEAVCTAANSFGFLLPGALGIREGGLLAIGTLLGIPPETVMALALIKRARELAVGIPGLGALILTSQSLWRAVAHATKD
jgi:putative membrane protein